MEGNGHGKGNHGCYVAFGRVIVGCHGGSYEKATGRGTNARRRFVQAILGGCIRTSISYTETCQNAM